MTKPTLIKFIENFKHVSIVSRVDCSDGPPIAVTLTEDYVYADTGFRQKIFETPQKALIGSNIINIKPLVSPKLVNGKISPNTVCAFREMCNEAKNGGCGHLGVDHVVEYSCGFARLFNIYNRG